jgi:hypothetical protein
MGGLVLRGKPVEMIKQHPKLILTAHNLAALAGNPELATTGIVGVLYVNAGMRGLPLLQPHDLITHLSFGPNLGYAPLWERFARCTDIDHGCHVAVHG